tara:strand:+ start:304 stop:534 length:231 start_codon:yes stop_codon:yes gene_type:complete
MLYFIVGGIFILSTLYFSTFISFKMKYKKIVKDRENLIEIKRNLEMDREINIDKIELIDETISKINDFLYEFKKIS